ncbi:MAG: mechanosensitive ion channel family protein [Anaerolineae bacterium]|nr:mechanosensitive ion channel family protein [Anaerolineae bacterium]
MVDGEIDLCALVGIEALLIQALKLVPRFILGVVIVAVFWRLGRGAERLVGRVFQGRNLDPDVQELSEAAAKIGVVSVGVITGLGTIGIDVMGLIAGLGLVGFAVGFALKDAISNALAGVLLLVYDPFKRGDVIAVAGKQGTVVEIDMRYTTLDTAEQRILVPNSQLLTNVVEVEKGGVGSET